MGGNTRASSRWWYYSSRLPYKRIAHMYISPGLNVPMGSAHACRRAESRRPLILAGIDARRFSAKPALVGSVIRGRDPKAPKAHAMGAGIGAFHSSVYKSTGFVAVSLALERSPNKWRLAKAANETAGSSPEVACRYPAVIPLVIAWARSSTRRKSSACPAGVPNRRWHSCSFRCRSRTSWRLMSNRDARRGASYWREARKKPKPNRTESTWESGAMARIALPLAIMRVPDFKIRAGPCAQTRKYILYHRAIARH